MKFPRPLFLLTILMVAAASAPGLVSLAQGAGFDLPSRVHQPTADLPDKSRPGSKSGFDFFLVDPFCDGSCVVTDQIGSWSQRLSFSGGEFNGVWGVDARDVYFGFTNFSGDSGVMRYQDEELTLETFPMPGGGFFNEKVYDLWGFSTESIFALGSQNWTTGINLFEYADGSWSQVAVRPSSPASYAIWGTSDSDIFTVGESGSIFHYDGEVLAPMSSPTTNTLNDIWGTATSNVFAVGDFGVILNFNGVHWLGLSSPTTNDLHGIWGTGPDDIFVVGSNSTILHWNGVNWTAMTAPIPGANLRAVYGSSHEEVIAVGENGSLFLYDGVQWVVDPTYTNFNNFQAIWGGYRTDGDQYWQNGWGASAPGNPDFDDEIFQIAEIAGQIAVVGGFTTFGEDSLKRMAVFDNDQWQPLYVSSGPNNFVRDLEFFDGTLFCAGNFTNLDGTPINCVAAWDGVSWNQVGNGLPAPANVGVLDLIVFENELYTLGDPDCTAKWNGTSWTFLGLGEVPDGIIVAGVIHQGELYAGGFLNGGNLRVLEGNSFASVDTAFTDGFVYCLESTGENLYLGGSFILPGFEDDPTMNSLAKWNGSGWESTGVVINGVVLGLKEVPGGLYVGGDFPTVNGEFFSGCAIWDEGDTWTPMGSGVSGSHAWDAHVINGEDIIVAGRFNGAGNRGPRHIATWTSQQLDLPAPPVSGPATAGEDYQLAINISGDPGPHPVYLRYRQRDGDPFSGSVMYKSTDKDGVYEGTVPGSLIGDLGFQFYVTTGSGTNPLFFPAAGPGGPAFQGVSLANESLGVPDANEYIMMGIPFVPDKALGEIMTDALGPYDKSKWRFGRWDPTTPGYDEFPAVDAVAPGRGYWLIQKDPVAIPASGLTTSTVGSVVVTLEPGWNMIATPYNFQISWSSVVRGPNVDDRLVARSAGVYDDVQVMEPWEGYWVHNRSGSVPSTITIQPIPLTKADALKSTPATKTDTTWELSFDVERGDRYDHSNVAGVSATAEPGIDSQDQFEVPPMPGDVSLYFEVKDGEKVESLSRDIRQEGAEGQSWDMVLKLAGGGTVQLSVDGPQQVPAEHDVILISADQTYNLREATDLRITVGASGETRLRLAVGNPGFVDEQEQTMPRPYALRKAYPNPFNPRTTVSFTLPSAGQVNIDIFDVRGHLVRRLVDETYEAGLHEVTWDGMDTKGRSVSAGVYFCRMQSGAFAQNQKMTLVR